MSKVKCITCGEILEIPPSDREPCPECGYNPKSKSKRMMTDGERPLDEYLNRSMGFRLRISEELIIGGE